MEKKTFGAQIPKEAIIQILKEKFYRKAFSVLKLLNVISEVSFYDIHRDNIFSEYIKHIRYSRNYLIVYVINEWWLLMKENKLRLIKIRDSSIRIFP